MSTYIVKLEGKYFEWSSEWDGPVSLAITLEEFRQRYLDRAVALALQELEERLERVEAKGTSARSDDSAEDTIWVNRAGAGDTCLSRAQIVAYLNAPVGTPAPLGVEQPESFEDWLKLDEDRT
jgi:hypothetical protein